MKIRRLISGILAVMVAMSLCACGSGKVAESAASLTSTSKQNEKVETSVSLAKEEKTVEENKPEAAPSATVYGEKKDGLHYVVVTINPEILVGVNDEGKIEYVENLNDDGADVLSAVLADGDSEKYESVEAFMNSYLSTVVEEGYGNAEEFTISVKAYDSNESEEVVNQIAESIAKAIPEEKLETENVAFLVGEEQKEKTWITCENCTLGIAVCPYCKGDWQHGVFVNTEVDCDSCHGTGTVKRIESYTVHAYNGTACRVCGDKGYVIDAYHGGESAPCGECMGYGKDHSVGDTAPGSYNGVYGQYAFDEKTITNEFDEPCPACNGTGKKAGESHYDPCLHCSYGHILCPVCNGAGGHFE